MGAVGRGGISYEAFNAGELSPRMDARRDLSKYKSGCRVLENAHMFVQGGFDSRQGMKMAAECKHADKLTRVIDFEFSVSTTYSIELGEGYMRFYKDQAQLSLGTATGWVTATAYKVGDFVLESSIIYYCIVAHTSGVFATDLGAGNWVAQSIYEIPTPYLEAELMAVQFEGINDIAYFTHPNHPNRKLIRYGDTNWDFSEIDYGLNRPYLDLNAGAITLTPGATTGSGVSLAASADLFSSDHVGSYFRIGHEREADTSIVPLAFPNWVTATAYEVGDGVDNGGTHYKCAEAHTSGTFATDLAANKWTADEDVSDVIRVQGDWEVKTTGFWRADVLVQESEDGSTNWKTIGKYVRKEDGNLNVAGTQETDIYMRIKVENFTDNKTTSGLAADTAKEYARAIIEVADAILYGTAEITGYTDEQNVTVTIESDLVSTSATTIWQENAWSDHQGHPRAVCFHEESVYYAGTTLKPNRFWRSKQGQYEKFLDGTDDDSPFSKEFGGQRMSRIEWLVSEKNLLIGLNGSEAIVTSGTENQALTPSNAANRRQTSEGSKHVRGIPVGDVAAFVTRDGKKMRTMLSQVQGDGSIGYESPDLTIFADHIAGEASGGITSIAYQQLPYPTIWASTAEGELISCVYQRDQDVIGWARHPTNGTVESVSVETGEEQDVVWVTTKRTIDGNVKRFMEYINPTPWKDSDSATLGIENAFYVDCGITISGPTTTVTAAHLPNTEVQILADGKPIGDDESPVTLDGSGQYTLTDSASVIHVGLKYTPVWSPMRIDETPEHGDTIGQEKAVYQLVARVIDTVGIEYGDGDSFHSHPYDYEDFRDTSDAMDTAVPPFTGEKILDFDGNVDLDTPIYIRQPQPLPLTLIAVTAKLVVTGDNK